MSNPLLARDGARSGKIAIRFRAIGTFGKADQWAEDASPPRTFLLVTRQPYREAARVAAVGLGASRGSEASSVRRPDASAFNMAMRACSAAGIRRRLG